MRATLRDLTSRVARGMLGPQEHIELPKVALPKPPRPADAAPPVPLAHRTSRFVRRRWLVLIALGFALLPIVTTTIGALADHWVPVGDDAIVALHTRDVFSSHPPLLGMSSGRYQATSG